MLEEEHVARVRFNDPRDAVHGVKKSYYVRFKVGHAKSKDHAEAKVRLHMKKNGYDVTSVKIIRRKKAKTMKEEIEIFEDADTDRAVAAFMAKGGRVKRFKTQPMKKELKYSKGHAFSSSTSYARGNINAKYNSRSGGSFGGTSIQSWQKGDVKENEAISELSSTYTAPARVPQRVMKDAAASRIAKIADRKGMSNKDVENVLFNQGAGRKSARKVSDSRSVKETVEAGLVTGKSVKVFYVEPGEEAMKSKVVETNKMDQFEARMAAMVEVSKEGKQIRGTKIMESVAGMDHANKIYSGNKSGGSTIWTDDERKDAKKRRPFSAGSVGKPANKNSKIYLVRKEGLEMDDPSVRLRAVLGRAVIKKSNKPNGYEGDTDDEKKIVSRFRAATNHGDDREGAGPTVFAATNIKKSVTAVNKDSTGDGDVAKYRTWNEQRLAKEGVEHPEPAHYGLVPHAHRDGTKHVVVASSDIGNRVGRSFVSGVHPKTGALKTTGLEHEAMHHDSAAAAENFVKAHSKKYDGKNGYERTVLNVLPARHQNAIESERKSQRSAWDKGDNSYGATRHPIHAFHGKIDGPHVHELPGEHALKWWEHKR